MHIDDRSSPYSRSSCGLGSTVAISNDRVCTFDESDLARILEVPALVLLVVVGVEPFLAEVAEVVGGQVRLRAIVRHDVALFLATTRSICLAYIPKRSGDE